MLDALRKGAGTIVAKLFIALLVLSFAVWGVADMFKGFGQNVVATVGDTEIPLITFDREYRRDLANFSSRIGRTLSTTEGAQFGLPQQTLGRLVAQAALDEAATSMRLGVSDERLISLIHADPAFQSPAGGYDRNRLAQVLRNAGVSEDEYVTDRRKLAERQQLAEAVSGGMVAPDAYLEAVNRFQGETRNVSYLTIDASSIGEIADPDQATLESYYEAQKEKFRAPEYRQDVLLELTPDSLARPGDVTDEAIKQEYDDNTDAYSQPERRMVRQIAFLNKEDADKAAEELKAGKTFDDLMAERNLADKDVSLGLMTKSDFLDPAIGDAAFSMETGETSGIIDGRFSSVVINVTEVQPAHTKPLEEVSADIRKTLAKETAEREVLDLLNDVEDARAGGESLQAVADRFQLKTITPAPFDNTGKGEDGKAVLLPDVDGLVAGTFDSDIGIENDPLPIGQRGFLWYEVTKVTPARDRELSEVRDGVIKAWKAEETDKRINARVKELVDKAKAGTSLADLAAENGLTVKTAENVKRGEASGDLSQEAATVIFSGPAGTITDAGEAKGNGRLILRVDATNTPAFFAESDDLKQIRDQLSQQLQDSLLNEYISQVEAEAGVEINQAAIGLVIGAPSN
ncbi:SurA N-terminal domain-containing protein [Roseibium litorale]|uniref:Parvulin-like PPIase n=1 Tax=Roseibium litorale TaxID=2803841 RepID=A0ABR9CJ01_9HYPH|nr:SurA N-terminal domain-containing protein [Roseibium litorale]MBD8890713.1 SurA N-terminal domain-containing protein [Roseibium litorale]